MKIGSPWDRIHSVNDWTVSVESRFRYLWDTAPSPSPPPSSSLLTKNVPLVIRGNFGGNFVEVSVPKTEYLIGLCYNAPKNLMFMNIHTIQNIMMNLILNASKRSFISDSNDIRYISVALRKTELWTFETSSLTRCCKMT